MNFWAAIAVALAAGCGGKADLDQVEPDASLSDAAQSSPSDGCSMTIGLRADANAAAGQTIQFEAPIDASCTAAAGCLITTSATSIATGATAQLVIGFQPFKQGVVDLEADVPSGAIGATYWYSETDTTGGRTWCAQSGTLSVEVAETRGSTGVVKFRIVGALLAPTTEFSANNLARGTLDGDVSCSLSTVAVN